MEDIEFFRTTLSLKSLVCNDFLREFYRSSETVLFRGEKMDLASFVYYLLPGGSVFPFHRMRSCSSWQFCAGAPLKVCTLSKQDGLQETLLGNDMRAGHKFFHLTPSDTWFCAESMGEYSLVIHCICPAYYERFEENGYMENMVDFYPKFSEILNKFCCRKGENDCYKLPESDYRIFD